jgi:hypothetical protein
VVFDPLDFLKTKSYIEYAKIMLEDRVGKPKKTYLIDTDEFSITIHVIDQNCDIQLYSGHAIPAVISPKNGNAFFSQILPFPKSRIENLLSKHFPEIYLQEGIQISIAESFFARIDLTPNPETLFKNLRSRYRSTIRKSLQKYLLKTEIFTEENVEKSYKFYSEISGGSKRTWVSWVKMWEAVKENEGLAIFIYEIETKRILGFAFFHYSNYSAYYSVGAFDRNEEFRKFGLGHAAIWSAMIALKDLKVENLYLTYVDIQSLTEKQISIMHFFSGFRFLEFKPLLLEIGKSRLITNEFR